MIKEVHIGWSRGETLISKLIERLDDSCFSHVYFKFVFDNGLRLIYESHLSGGVQITPYEHLEEIQRKGDVSFVHEVKLDNCIPELVWKECLKYHGDSYDKGQILRYWLWIRLFHKKHKKLVTRYRNDKFTCNEFCVTVGLETIRSMFGLDLSYTPERLFRHIVGKPSKEIYGDNRKST